MHVCNLFSAFQIISVQNAKYLFIYLPNLLFIYLIYRSIDLFIYLSIYLTIYLSN